MMKRMIPVLFSIFVLGFLTGCSDKESTPMNVLFIAIDDLKPSLGCYGNESMISPNIDAIAARGSVFLNNHCQQAVCGASRASLLTGLYPDQNRVWGFYGFRERNPGIVTLPQHFKNNGYTTVNIAKIFDYRTVDRGADSISWSWPYFPKGQDIHPYYHPASGPEAGYFYQSPKVKALYEEMKVKAAEEGGNPNSMLHKIIKPSTECLDLPDTAYKDAIFASRAIESLDILASEGKPFFLALGFHRPHLPFTAPKKYWDMYEGDQVELSPYRAYAANDQDYYYSNSGELMSYSDEEGNWPYEKLKDQELGLSDEEQRHLIHGYMAAVTYIDVQVGRVIKKLQDLGLEENTIVVVWGDHGWHLGDHGVWCKHSNFEQATRSPLIISVPGKAGRTIMQPTEFTDLYPTLCELTGLAGPGHISGQSLCALLDGEEDPENLYAFSQYPRGRKMGYAIRDERYRYVEWMAEGRHKNPEASLDELDGKQLFDYETDPYETVNVAGHEDYSEEEARMKAALHVWLENL